MESGVRQLNPWVSMWTKPRTTIQQIVKTNPEHLVFLLAAIAGISKAMDRAVIRSLGDQWHWPSIFLFALIGGTISGIVGLYIGSTLIRWTGTWIGGKASAQNIRAAVAWSCVPVAWAMLLWIPQLGLFGQELFTTETPNLDANPSLSYSLFGFLGVEFVIGIWTVVVLLKCLGQVQGFSAWRALGNLSLAGLVFLIPLLLMVFVIV